MSEGERIDYRLTYAFPRSGTWDSSGAIPVMPCKAKCANCEAAVHLSVMGGNPMWFHANGFTDCHHD